MPRFLLIDNGSRHTVALAKLLPEFPEIVRFDRLGSFDIAPYDCILLSGSSELPLFGNEALFETELSLIRDSSLPIIGICLGAELIAHAFGGTLVDLGEKRKGLVEITATGESVFLLETGRVFSVYEAHRFAIETLPEGFFAIAQSDHGPEIIKHRSRPIWGLQFHPEHLAEATLGDEMFARILAHSLPRK